MASHRVSLRDVAKKAGVSVGTASDILNRKGPYSDSTRNHVLQTARELHYAPNALIRSLQKGRTMTIGVAVWGFEEPSNTIAVPLLRGISRGVAATDRDMLYYCSWAHRLGEGSISAFLDKRVDGLIWAPGTTAPVCLDALSASKLPAIILYNHETRPGLGAVDVDDRGGAFQAVEHLIRLGHRRIAFHGRLGTPDFAQRAEGYRSALESGGLPFDPALYKCLDSWLEARDVIHQVLALPDPPTAAFVASDLRACIWLDVLRERGVRVPGDFSLVGFDDVPGAGSATGLTTVRQPSQEVGRLAATFVDALIEGASAQECHAVLPVELIVRNTTAPPPRRNVRD